MISDRWWDVLHVVFSPRHVTSMRGFNDLRRWVVTVNVKRGGYFLAWKPLILEVYLVCKPLILEVYMTLPPGTTVFSEWRLLTPTSAGPRLVDQGWSSQWGNIGMFGLIGPEIRSSVREWLSPPWFLEHALHGPYSEETRRSDGHGPSYQGRSLRIVDLVPIRRSDGSTSRNHRKDPGPPS